MSTTVARKRLAEAVGAVGNGSGREWNRGSAGIRRTGVKNVDALRLALIQNGEVFLL
jgi:hypothetical protein